MKLEQNFLYLFNDYKGLRHNELDERFYRNFYIENWEQRAFIYDHNGEYFRYTVDRRLLMILDATCLNPIILTIYNDMKEELMAYISTISYKFAFIKENLLIRNDFNGNKDFDKQSIAELEDVFLTKVPTSLYNLTKILCRYEDGRLVGFEPYFNVYYEQYHNELDTNFEYFKYIFSNPKLFISRSFFDYKRIEKSLDKCRCL